MQIVVLQRLEQLEEYEKNSFYCWPLYLKFRGKCKKSIYWANVVMNEGYIPIIPHLYHFMNKEYPRTEEIWRETSLDIFKRCDILFRILGESEGADKEVQLATELGIPVWRCECQIGVKMI